MFHLKDPFSGLGAASIVFVIPRQVATCKAVVMPVENCTAVYSGTVSQEYEVLSSTS